MTAAGPGAIRLRRLATADLTPAEAQAIRVILWAAFEADEDGFAEDDWQHALGGVHFVLDVDGVIAAHASVVERSIQAGDRPLRTGYVEAVATAPERQGRGFGTAVMREVTEHVRATFELGALGTGRHHFYERLGWLTWKGPSHVRLPDGSLQRTPKDDGYILVLPTPASPPLDPAAPISCEWRPGDFW